MQILAGATVLALLVAALLISIFKGSRPPQPIPPIPAPLPRRAALAAIVPFACALIPYLTFKGVEQYRRSHFASPSPLIILSVGVIAPWFVGLYSAYTAACAANKLLRAIGALEVLIFLLAAGFSLLSR